MLQLRIASTLGYLLPESLGSAPVWLIKFCNRLPIFRSKRVSMFEFARVLRAILANVIEVTVFSGVELVAFFAGLSPVPFNRKLMFWFVYI